MDTKKLSRHLAPGVMYEEDEAVLAGAGVVLEEVVRPVYAVPEVVGGAERPTATLHLLR